MGGGTVTAQELLRYLLSVYLCEQGTTPGKLPGRSPYPQA